MSGAYINRIATAVPEHEVHQFYLRFAASMLAANRRRVLRTHGRACRHREPLFLLCTRD